jgi:hypothetical protein
MSGDMGKIKQRQAANTASAIEAKTLSVNERILKVNSMIRETLNG